MKKFNKQNFLDFLQDHSKLALFILLVVITAILLFVFYKILSSENIQPFTKTFIQGVSVYAYLASTAAGIFIYVVGIFVSILGFTTLGNVRDQATGAIFFGVICIIISLTFTIATQLYHPASIF